MKVAMYYNNRDVRLEEMPVPALGPGELLVRVHASGVCGTDVMEWYRIQKAPLVLGHEIAGEVAAVGEGVEPFEIGDRVFVSHHVPCNQCRYCLSGHHSVCDTLRTTRFDPGGFAEYVRVPKINVETGTFLLPAGLSFAAGSFIEPLGCVARGQRLARFAPGRSVLVVGSGISGLLHVQLARARGAARVLATDVNEFRMQAAKRLGADGVIAAGDDVPSRLRDLNDGRLADLVIVSTGAMPAMLQALECVDRGGTILFFAPTAAGVTVPFPIYELWRNEVTATTSYAASPQDLLEAMALLQSGAVQAEPMITHRLSLAEAGLGFSLVAGARDSIKVLLEPQRA